MNNYIKKIRKILIVCFTLILVISGNSYAEERFSDQYSTSAIISDFKTGRIIYEKNADKKTAMASLSKIMTLLVTLEAIDKNKVSKEDAVTIISSDYNREGTNMKLTPGEKVKLGHMMDGLMIVSANDAALAIARHVGGDYKSFVNLMNKKAHEIGMTDTVFYNPNGLPTTINIDGKSKMVENQTTARDVLKLCKYIYGKYPDQVIEITNKNKFIDSAKAINEENTNPLLPLIPEVDGLKTGFTNAAGYCLTYSMPTKVDGKNQISNRILGVSLGAESKEARKTASYESLTYIKNHYHSKVFRKANQEVVNVDINGMKNLNTKLVAQKDIVLVQKDGENISQEITYNKINISREPNAPLGKLVLKDQHNNILASANLYSDVAPEKFGVFAKIQLFFSSIFADDGEKENSKYLLKYPICELF